ncbi:MAG: hypothetical protein HKN00_09920 [Flavobacteriaceae bacterium]|nr:hypothetical protein [Flavobacteriaceae bacterium]
MKREIGSSFYKLNSEDKEYKALADNKIELEDHYTLYSSGRSAFLAILEEIHRSKDVKHIWIPEYYCHNVTGFLERNYDTIKYYYINPFEYQTKFNFQDFAKKGDVIVLNNYWGLFNYDYDPQNQDRPIIIEDHSHGWLTQQCLNSQADYCLASVRKSYPVSGGGVAWRPGSMLEEPYYETKADEAIEDAHIILSQSINKKRSFLKDDKGDKKSYLNLLSAGEAQITESNSYVRPNPELYEALEHYISLDINVVKSENLQTVLELIKPSSHFQIVNREGYIPFGLLLLFKDEASFKDFKTFCIQKNIYPANLWPDNDLRSEWKYFFNIHIDFRYDDEDMRYLAHCVNEWSETQVLSTI